MQYHKYLIKNVSLLFVFSFFYTIVSSQGFLANPIEGELNKDYVIVNYVDWGLTGFKDHYCGTKTYDGHQGTDFVLKSFDQMDSGVYVLAAEDGEIIAKIDGLFDRETEGHIAKKLGNYLGVKHANKYYSYYGHLKKNSLLVNVGDMVKKGQRLAKVGSSGNSTDPHLHFELWYDSTTLTDPFMGSCGNAKSLWLKEPKYDTLIRVLDKGMYDTIASINYLRLRKSTLKPPYKYRSNGQEKVGFWALLSGLKKDSVLTVNWYDPTDKLWFTYNYKMAKDWWYYYFWSHIDQQKLPIGAWRVEIVYEGKKVVEETFSIQKTMSSVVQVTKTNNCSKSIEYIYENKVLNNLKIYNTKMQYIDCESIALLQQGAYFITWQENRKYCYKKFVKTN